MVGGKPAFLQGTCLLARFLCCAGSVGKPETISPHLPPQKTPASEVARLLLTGRNGCISVSFSFLVWLYLTPESPVDRLTYVYWIFVPAFWIFKELCCFPSIRNAGYHWKRKPYNILSWGPSKQLIQGQGGRRFPLCSFPALCTALLHPTHYTRPYRNRGGQEGQNHLSQRDANCCLSPTQW